ncbi:MAG: P-loop NTPase [Candidatus Coatesbacteria bacterium]|nr:P-loop NTPase [Candidatus Coatesbacteria bacterium]
MADNGREERDARRPGEDEKRWQLRVAVNRKLDTFKNKLLVFSGKGGVGKSTVAANLAVLLAERGRKVGLLDIDFHGPSIPKLMGVEGKQMPTVGEDVAPVIGPAGVEVVSLGFLLADPKQATIWRGPLKMGVIQQLIGTVAWSELDWLIIDSPPGTGDEPLSVAQTIVGAYGLLVTTPQRLSTADVRRSIGFAEKVGMELVGVLENMAGLVCPHCGGEIDVFGSGGGAEMTTEAEVPFLGSVPLDPRVVGGGDEGRPVVLELPDSPVSAALKRAADKLLELE